MPSHCRILAHRMPTELQFLSTLFKMKLGAYDPISIRDKSEQETLDNIKNSF